MIKLNVNARNDSGIEDVPPLPKMVIKPGEKADVDEVVRAHRMKLEKNMKKRVMDSDESQLITREDNQ